jgi:predicted CXXCH cytochrome family protein
MTTTLRVVTGCAAMLFASVGVVKAQDRVEEARKAFQGDVHMTAGLQCAACHSGASEAEASSYVTERTRIAPMCATCHSDPAYMRQFDPQVRTDQYAQYLTSAHGREMARGEVRVATCSDCHGAHGVVRVSDPRAPVAPLHVAETCAACHADRERMAAFGHEATPFADWSTSVHATALLKRGDTSAPACSTCHGSHGATPPGVTEVANVCAQCHVREADLFRASPKKAIFDDMGQAECLVCHENHAIQHPPDAWVGLGQDAVCATCHDASTNGAQTILAVRQGLDALTRNLGSAESVVERAERAGMLVDDARVMLQEAREHQIQARVLVHTFADKPFADVAAKGLEAVQRAERAGEEALAELQFRRRGLAVATLVIIGFLITLGWKIRRLPAPES